MKVVSELNLPMQFYLTFTFRLSTRCRKYLNMSKSKESLRNLYSPTGVFMMNFLKGANEINTI